MNSSHLEEGPTRPNAAATQAQVDAWFVKHYDAIRASARARRKRRDTQVTTEVAHEAYARLRTSMPPLHDETEFLRYLRIHETQVLCNNARKRNAAKRGGQARRVEMPDDIAVEDQDPHIAEEEWRELRAELETRLPEAAVVVACRIDLGMQVREIAELLQLSERTVRNRLNVVKGWIEERRRGSI